MSGAAATTRGETHTVTNSMNDYGAMTVSTPDTHLRRAGTRANVWEVAELLPGR